MPVQMIVFRVENEQHPDGCASLTVGDSKL